MYLFTTALIHFPSPPFVFPAALRLPRDLILTLGRHSLDLYTYRGQRNSAAAVRTPEAKVEPQSAEFAMPTTCSNSRCQTRPWTSRAMILAGGAVTTLCVREQTSIDVSWNSIVNIIIINIIIWRRVKLNFRSLKFVYALYYFMFFDLVYPSKLRELQTISTRLLDRVQIMISFVIII